MEFYGWFTPLEIWPPKVSHMFVQGSHTFATFLPMHNVCGCGHAHICRWQPLPDLPKRQYSSEPAFITWLFYACCYTVGLSIPRPSLVVLHTEGLLFHMQHCKAGNSAWDWGWGYESSPNMRWYPVFCLMCWLLGIIHYGNRSLGNVCIKSFTLYIFMFRMSSICPKFFNVKRACLVCP